MTIQNVTTSVNSVEIAKLRLTIDVSYSLNGESAQTMIDLLQEMINYSIGNGFLSGHTMAEVDDYFVNICRISCELDKGENDDVSIKEQLNTVNVLA